MRMLLSHHNLNYLVNYNCHNCRLFARLDTWAHGTA